MTADNTSPEPESLLEEILQHVRSIDQNVDAVLERLGEHLDEVRYRGEWENYRVGDENGYY
jgi:hypothetical protein